MPRKPIRFAVPGEAPARPLPATLLCLSSCPSRAKSWSGALQRALGLGPASAHQWEVPWLIKGGRLV